MNCGTYCMMSETCLGFFFKENEICRLVSSSMLDKLITSHRIQYYEKAAPVSSLHKRN